jgi:Mg2+-importing ATPase
LIVRTRHVPWQSTPSRALILSTSAGVIAGVILPFSPLSGMLGFVQPPVAMLATIGFLVILYLTMAELVKRRLYGESQDSSNRISRGFDRV